MKMDFFKDALFHSVRGIGNRLVALNPRSSSASYWTRHNVTLHARFKSREESVECFEWRNSQYLGYIDLMPVSGFDNLVVLDYGCGPGHDLVGFKTFSRPQRLIGMDVSATSLSEAKCRLSLHGGNVDLIKVSENETKLPLADSSVDVVHCSGVLHHMPDPLQILLEFKRVLRPNGFAQIMVYNYDSIWMHLYVAYQRMILRRQGSALSLREAFRSSTDGPTCPISECYTPEQFIDLSRGAGLDATGRGVAISAREMKLLPLRWDALQDVRLNSISRRFLSELGEDARGLPTYQGKVAGIDSCFELRSSNHRG